MNFKENTFYKAAEQVRGKQIPEGFYYVTKVQDRKVSIIITEKEMLPAKAGVFTVSKDVLELLVDETYQPKAIEDIISEDRTISDSDRRLVSGLEGSVKNCCLCGDEICFLEWNNPDPVVTDPDAVCCPKCNAKYVIPARLKEYRKLNREEQNTQEGDR